MSDLTVALITIFGTVALVSGVVIYVFNGTRTLIREMHATTREMHATIKEMHTTLVTIHKESEKRHQEITE
jgi:predicted PurR-regulated permease PerM